jgi:hypothetical protein
MNKRTASSISDSYGVRNVGSVAVATLLAHVKLIALGMFGLAVLYTLADVPYVAILVVDVLFCGYLAKIFKTTYRHLFLLHPLILFVISQLFATPFLQAGDGEAYQAVVAQYLNTQDLTFDASGLLLNYGLLGFFRYASLGIAPLYAIPDFFLNNPADVVYYLWQGTFHVILCALVLTLAHSWRVLDEKDLFSMGLFAVISPSFFELGGAPTRHIVTFFGVFLLLITHVAILQKFTLVRGSWFSVAVLAVLISKAPLLAPYMIFVAVDLIFVQRIKLNFRSVLLLSVLIVGSLVLGAYLYQTTLDYEETAKGGAATFSGLIELPIIGWVVKYVYALLAPFPWSEAALFVSTIYAGNGLLFFMHVLSSLTGIYMLLVVMLKWRLILASNIELKQLIAYGFIMSLSILKGATGFHTYLLIYFPMFAPLLGLRRFKINPLIPVGLVTLFEIVVFVSK